MVMIFGLVLFVSMLFPMIEFHYGINMPFVIVNEFQLFIFGFEIEISEEVLRKILSKEMLVIPATIMSISIEQLSKK